MTKYQILNTDLILIFFQLGRGDLDFYLWDQKPLYTLMLWLVIAGTRKSWEKELLSTQIKGPREC